VGVQRTAFRVQENAGAGKSAYGLRVLLYVPAPAISRLFGQDIVHTTGAHVDIPFVGVEKVPIVPVDPMQPQAKGNQQDEGKNQEGPG